MQRLSESALRSNERSIALHPIRQCLERLKLLGKNRRCIRAGVHFPTENGGDEVGTLREVPVNGADADAGTFGDVSHRSVHPGGCKQRHGRLEQRVDVAFRVRAHAPLWIARLQAFFRIFRLATQHQPP